MSDHRPFQSKGENLASYLHRNFFGRGKGGWERLSPILLPSNRADEWIIAFQEMVVLQLVRRLIAAGSVLFDRYNGEGDELVGESAIKKMIDDTMVVYSSDDIDEIYGRLLPAIRVANSPVSRGTKRRIMSITQRNFPYCYLCGVDLDFNGLTSDNPHCVATIDHVWPRAYGGDSELENLLVACKACNERKSDIPSWAMYPIQALVEKHDRDLEKLPKIIRFSVHTRKAHEVAAEERVSLRDAFIKLGRPETPTVIDNSIAIDIFNLTYEAVLY